MNGAGLNSLSQKIFLLPWGSARAATVREWREAQAMWPHYFGWEAGTTLSVFALGLVPCAVVPPLLPFATLFFFIKLHVDKYNLLYIRPCTVGNSDSNLGLVAIHIVAFCGLFFCAANCCVVGYWGTRSQLLMLLVLFFGGCVLCIWFYATTIIHTSQWITSLAKHEVYDVHDDNGHHDEQEDDNEASSDSASPPLDDLSPQQRARSGSFDFDDRAAETGFICPLYVNPYYGDCGYVAGWGQGKKGDGSGVEDQAPRWALSADVPAAPTPRAGYEWIY
jgi:hypothetical protein